MDGLHLPLYSKPSFFFLIRGTCQPNKRDFCVFLSVVKEGVRVVDTDKGHGRSDLNDAMFIYDWEAGHGQFVIDM